MRWLVWADPSTDYSTTPIVPKNVKLDCPCLSMILIYCRAASANFFHQNSDTSVSTRLYNRFHYAEFIQIVPCQKWMNRKTGLGIRCMLQITDMPTEVYPSKTYVMVKNDNQILELFTWGTFTRVHFAFQHFRPTLALFPTRFAIHVGPHCTLWLRLNMQNLLFIAILCQMAASYLVPILSLFYRFLSNGFTAHWMCLRWLLTSAAIRWASYHAKIRIRDECASSSSLAHNRWRTTWASVLVNHSRESSASNLRTDQ